MNPEYDKAEHFLQKYLQHIFPYQDKNNHIQNTSRRFLNYIHEYTQGYNEDIYEVVQSAIYSNPYKGSLQTICQKDIKFCSICVHHLLPFNGTIDISYIPDKYILGLSKFSKICEILSRRFTLQEQLGHDIVKHLFSILEPKEITVTLRAQHCCMSCRGVRNKAVTETIHHLKQ